MYKCAFCGENVDKDTKTCPKCGCGEIVDYYTYYDETPFEQYNEEEQDYLWEQIDEESEEY